MARGREFRPRCLDREGSLPHCNDCGTRDLSRRRVQGHASAQRTNTGVPQSCSASSAKEAVDSSVEESRSAKTYQAVHRLRQSSDGRVGPSDKVLYKSKESLLAPGLVPLSRRRRK